MAVVPEQLARQMLHVRSTGKFMSDSSALLTTARISCITAQHSTAHSTACLSSTDSSQPCDRRSCHCLLLALRCLQHKAAFARTTYPLLLRPDRCHLLHR
jgi:hypothetical protein